MIPDELRVISILGGIVSTVAVVGLTAVLFPEQDGSRVAPVIMLRFVLRTLEAFA
jgi:hypothetical protein